ncbi:Uncharacterised protein [Vibrio cholerae]|nr:Uncharacterised protein [Vibrio cholerae]CSD36456.1 Uncharacterised protein [Vibrio cholerae]CSH86676.1 Uncharacterised protein [Vibrio cholerae]
MACFCKRLSLVSVMTSSMPCASMISCSACTVPLAPTHTFQPSSVY